MGRKNSRAEDHPPLEAATPYVPPAPKVSMPRAERQALSDAAFHRTRERNERRADKRIAGAVDWDTCCIPGCNYDLTPKWSPRPNNVAPRPDPDVADELPLCQRHLVIVRKQAMARWGDPDIIAEREKHASRIVKAERQAEARADKAFENHGADGQIYFVRQNGLIKVGWSSKLRSRLKQYGADVEILCHFPASRADETLLHRQLRPYLARGREWYEDCKLINDVVEGYVKQYGEPVIFPSWTEPKPPTIRVRKAS